MTLLVVYTSAVYAEELASYVVQPDDTLTSIASMTGTSVEDLIRLNAIANPDSVVAGAVLLVPAVTPATRSTTSRGGPRAAIVGEPTTVVPTIATAVPVTPLATVTPPSSAYPPQAPGTNASGAGLTYIMQPQDTLDSIARRFGVTVEDLLVANHISSTDRIPAGYALRVEAGAASRQGPSQSTTAPTGTPTRTVVGTLGAAATRTPTPTVATAGTSSLAAAASTEVVSIAMRYVGYPYVFGGTTPAGFDCSGLIYFVFREAGRPVSRNLFDLYRAGPHPARSELQPGDLVFFENTYTDGLSHAGIYIGNQQFISAIDEENGVRISTLTAEYWTSRWYGATRIP